MYSQTLGGLDLAEFTGAKERVALGKKAKKAEAKRRRAGIAEMIEDVSVHLIPSPTLVLILGGREQDDDEETREWEMRQIQRTEGPDKQDAKAPKAIYKPAPSKWVVVDERQVR